MNRKEIVLEVNDETTMCIFLCFADRHLSIFISVFNQLDAQNLFHNKFYFMPLHVSSTCVRNMWRHEIKLIVKQILCIKLVKY